MIIGKNAVQTQVVSLRLDPKLYRLVKRLCKRLGITYSMGVNEALESWAERKQKEQR